MTMPNMPAQTSPAGDSAAQRAAEPYILAELERTLGTSLRDVFPERGPRLDGFANGDMPILVEIWAHQGRAKSAQQAKLMKDACKMLLCERLIRRSCRKILAVTDQEAKNHLTDSTWQGQFIREFAFEILVVPLPEDLREKILQAQQRQYR